MDANHLNKTRFLSICEKAIHRDGTAELLDWLESKSDFFSAPASSRFHLAYCGGLVKHSLNVYDQLVLLKEAYRQFIADESEFSDESIAVVALMHDLCKVNMYKPDTRNVKVNGVWTTEPVYTIDEKFAYGGHGSKSVFLVERFIKLKPHEAVAINCHMGSWDGGKNVGNAYGKNMLAWLLHVADEAATFVVEKE